MMKRIILGTLVCLLTVNFSMAQKVHETIKWQDRDREFVVYTPEDSAIMETPHAIYFTLHGLRNDIDTISKLVDFQAFANKTNWIVVVPQAIPYQTTVIGIPVDLGCTWNSGISISFMTQTYAINSEIDDSGFLMALLDSMQNRFNIAKDSVFFGGVSMGGFMVQRLAIEHSDRISGIASVSGTIANTLKDQKPTNPVNVIHFHGTGDTIVTYEGNFKFGQITLPVGLGADETVKYWCTENSCASKDYCDTLPHAQADNLLFVRHKYYGGEAGSRVAFVKVYNGRHWFYGASDSCDVNFNDVIYEFFTDKYKPVESGIVSERQLNSKIYPNPAHNTLNIELPNGMEKANISIFDAAGRVVMQQETSERLNSLSVSDLVRGIYFVRIQSEQGNSTQKFIVE